MIFLLKMVLAATVFFQMCGCQPSSRLPAKRWNTMAVTGKVHIDGAPAAGVAITATPEPGAEIAYPVSTTTVEDGSFLFSTYMSGDGLPVGTFKLTFEKLSPGAPGTINDALNGRYADVAKSELKFTVESGKPVDLNVIELTTKK